ncbi:tyrosine-type recombinase/integrase [Nonomuraea turcica]|uniref:tyrosine-type recombinase/integrase n=1 Tax=Nonomuraea sp. G32 TaxID=3067274 RepID=UPI00273AA388|nr:tyrosine-type recombinase/integrase [Nonomuraea sp. G32]MDP4510365.1 tyrosine-type recombinase/integrase [Nonomuraea sp. G32]
MPLRLVEARPCPEGTGGDLITFFTSLTVPQFLAEVGWDADRVVLSIPREHPLLGWRACRIEGCTTGTRTTLGFCSSCANRFHASGLSMEDFLAIGRVSRRSELGRCAVTGCGRPWKTARSQLCRAHAHQQQQVLRLPLDEFLAHPSVLPLLSYGPCAVVACLRDRDGSRALYCHAHYERWKLRQKSGVTDEEHWRRIEPAIPEGGEISLRGLSQLVVAQVLFGLQQRCRKGSKTLVTDLRRVCDYLRKQQVASIADLDIATMRRTAAATWKSMTRFVLLATKSPETERTKLVWDASVFGRRGNLDFTAITQPWLREAVMRWALEELPRRRGNAVTNVVQQRISSMARLSESLRAHRKDNGLVLAALERRDIESFLNRLGYLESIGTLSSDQRLKICRAVRNMLVRMRAMGLTRPDEPLAGLPEDFIVLPHDIPAEPVRGEPGRDVPPEILQQLCDALPRIEETSVRETRVAVELMIDTGRRPDEICSLDWDCLHRDGEGRPLLIYDNDKEQRLRRELPIAEATAQLIIEQKEHVQRRFPRTPLSELKLFPSPVANPAGRKAISESSVSERHRAWVRSLPPLILSDGSTLDKSKVVPYSYRHSYAQRHADAGVPIDVLSKLLDHDSLSSTQVYYRVGEKRRRQAVEKVTAMQFDRHGARVWRQAKAFQDAERLRRGVGEVAVAYGLCTEPSNVQAAGTSCPLRFRCLGCDHFSTDVSYLPDLEAYLADLLRSRERILAMATADEWAKAEALPSQEEITRVRRLIHRVRQDLNDLTDDEREQISEAISIVRKTRQVMLGMPRVRQPLADLRPERPA